MANRLLIRSKVFPYHVTARSNNREPFPGDSLKIWKLFNQIAYEVSFIRKAKIHAFVQMPNHIHMILSTPEDDLGRVMQHFFGSGTRTLNRKLGRSGRIFGGPYYRTIIQSPTYYSHVLKYVYRNPVKANLCEKVEEYPYSSLPGILGLARLEMPISPDSPENFLKPTSTVLNSILPWLNQPHPKELQEIMMKALKRKSFSIPHCHSNWMIQMLKDNPI